MVGTVTTYRVSNSSSTMVGTSDWSLSAATISGTVLLWPTTSARQPRFSRSTRFASAFESVFPAMISGVTPNRCATPAAVC